MAALLLRIERESQGRVRICRTVGDIEHCFANDTLATVLHIEGAEAIDENFDVLNVLHAAGLRSLGPVWSRPNAFGYGVPFRCPSSPDTGPGLTDLGKALVAECNRLRIMIDLSHLNEKGFWDVAALSNAPLVATHSNAHALSPHSRNLTDKQLAAIRETGGMVGVNYAVSFLRPDGKQDKNTPAQLIVDHAAYLIEHLGEDGVGLGSDFDGAHDPGEARQRRRLANSGRGHGTAPVRQGADRESVLSQLASRARAHVAGRLDCGERSVKAASHSSRSHAKMSSACPAAAAHGTGDARCARSPSLSSFCSRCRI